MYFLSGIGDDVSVDYGPGPAGPRPAENLTDIYAPPQAVTALPLYARLGSGVGRQIRPHLQEGQLDVDYGVPAAGKPPGTSVNATYPSANAVTAAPFAVTAADAAKVAVQQAVAAATASGAAPCSIRWWPAAAPAPKSAFGWLLVGLAGGFVAAKILK